MYSRGCDVLRLGLGSRKERRAWSERSQNVSMEKNERTGQSKCLMLARLCMQQAMQRAGEVSSDEVSGRGACCCES
jgi:hypothetical protein